MAQPKKRTVLAWMTIGVLAADVATEAFRLGMCSSLPEADQPSICRQQGGTVAALTAKIRTLMQVWAGVQSHPIEPPPPLSQDGSRIEQPANASEF